MEYKLEDLIDIRLLQSLQEKLNGIYSFPSAVIDLDGKILTAVDWQDVCTKFHRAHPDCEKECIKSDKYILNHLHEANPAISYTCPHGLIDNAAPIIIDGMHLGTFFTGQFFLEKPDLGYFRKQARTYGFDEKAYLEAVEKVPVWTREKVSLYIDFISSFIEIIATIGLNQLKEIKANQAVRISEDRYRRAQEVGHVGSWEYDLKGNFWGSDEVKRIFGFNPDNSSVFVSEVMNCIIDRAGVDQAMTDLIEKGMPYNIVFDIVSYNSGEKRTINSMAELIRDSDGNPVKVSGVLLDITERMRIEQRLQENEEKYHNLVDFSPDAIFINHDNRVRLVNHACLKLFGATREDELLGMNPMDLFHPDCYEMVRHRIEVLQKDGKPVPAVEEKIVRLDGKVVDVEVVAAPFQMGGENVIHVILRDISERKKAETELRESEQRWQFALEGGGNGVWDWNVKTNDVYYSRRWKEMLGYNENEIEHKFEEWSNRVHPDDLQQCFDGLDRHFRNETPYYQTEHRILCKDGTYKWIMVIGKVFEWDSEGNPERVIGTHQDITERKLSEIELERSHNLLFKLAQQVPGVIYQYRLYPDGTSSFPYSSEGMFEIYEVTSGEVREDASQVFTRIHPDDYDMIVDTINQSARNLTPYHSEFRVVLPRQGLRWRMCDAKPELLEDGSILWHGIISDITDRKTIENELIKTKEQAEESSRLKTSLLMNMSHELRTPLNGIMGFSGLLREILTDPEEKNMADIITISGKRLMTTLNSIMELAQVEADRNLIDPEDLDLGVVTSEVLHKHSELFGRKRLTIVESIDQQICTKLDKSLFSNIIFHLVDNAIKFTDTGTINIIVKSEVISNLPWAVLKVRDTGKGITDEQLEYIFDAFRQGEEGIGRSYEGTGLGLTLCKKFAEAMGGKIEVESKSGVGSTFTVRFPVSVSTISEINIAESDEPEAGSGDPVNKPMVLIVEDNEFNADLTSRFLKEKYVTDIAYSGIQAIKMAYMTRYDMILMDINLGHEMDGIRATREIRTIEGYSLTPIIAVTGYSNPNEKQFILSQGLTDFLSKPFNRKELLEIMQKSLRRKT